MTSGVHVFFDEQHVMVAPLASSSDGHAYLHEQSWVFEQPVDSAELVAAVRMAWELPHDPRDLESDDLSATWDPVRELFGNERYSETNYVLANRIVNDRVMRNGRKVSKRLISVSATGWRNGNRDYDIEEARARFGLDVSDEDLAAAIRAAMAATFGPHDK